MERSSEVGQMLADTKEMDLVKIMYNTGLSTHD